MAENREFLNKLRIKIPFLNQIPDEIFFNLDTSEFYLPENDISVARTKLEEKLNQYVMTYKLSVLNLSIPVEKHLCANIKPVQLTKRQLRILQTYEDKYKPKGVSFVIYEKPLVLIPPHESDMYKLYVKEGLV